jgi:hypothetical protein
VQFGRIGEDLTDLYHVFRENVAGFTVETKDDILRYFDEDEHAYATWEKFLLDCKTEALKPLQPEPLQQVDLGPNVPNDVLEPNVPNDVLEPNVPNDVLEPNVPNDVLGPNVPKDVLGPNVPNDVLEPNVPNDVLEPNVPNDVLGPNVPNDVLGPNVPNDVLEPNVPNDVMPCLESFGIKQAEHVANSMESVLAKYGLNAIKTLMNLTDAQVEKCVHMLRELNAASTTRDMAGLSERIIPAFYLSPSVLVEPMTVFTEERTQLFDTKYGVVGIRDKQIYGPLLARSYPLSAATFDRSHVAEKKINGLIMVRYLYKREPNITINACSKKICNFCRRFTTGLVDGTCAKCKCVYCGRASKKDICDSCNFSMYLQTAVELEGPIRAKCGNLLFAYEADNRAIQLEARKDELERERKVELERERQRAEAMADIVAAAVKNGVSADVAKNIAQTMITPGVVKNEKPVDVAGDDNESTEELDESEEEKPIRHQRLDKDLKRVRSYRKRKREEMGEEAYKAMNREYNRDYRARRKQQDAEEARRLAALEEKHP